MPRIAKQFRYNAGARIANGVIGRLAGAGLGPKALHQVTVRGRKTGRTYSTPILVVETSGGRYWVGVFGETEMVKNARAGGRLTLKRGRAHQDVRLREIPVSERVPYLRARAALGINSNVRPYFDVTPQTSDAEFAAIADAHPVFKLEPS
jgi:hypothetical protein